MYPNIDQKMAPKHISSPLAKLTRPQFTRAIDRTRLYQQIENTRINSPLVWLSAPAGAGKTTLVSRYLINYHRPCLWYQVDAGDADPATFFHYLGLGAQQFTHDTHNDFPALTPEYLPGLSIFARRFFEQLYLLLTPPAALVFDNYQEIPVDSPVHEVLRIACEALPAGLCILVMSRTEAPATLARQRIHGDLKLLDEAELRFTREETVELIVQRYSKSKVLSDGGVEQLHTHTQGWAAGLVLLLEQAQPTTTRSLPLAVATQEVLFNYFAGEVFSHASREAQDLLLYTALFPQFTAAMAEQLTGNSAANQFLRQLHERNFFIYRRDDKEVSFEYHPLFREFLLNRARLALSPEAFAQCQRQAALLLEQAGQAEAAAALYRETGEATGLVRLIVTQAPRLLRQGRHLTLSQWLADLPTGVFDGNPWLYYWQGQARLPFSPSDAKTMLEQAYFQFKASDDVTGLYLACAGIMQTFLVALYDYTPMDRWITEFETLWAQHPELLSPEVELQMYSSLGVLMRRPGSATLFQWARRGLILLREPLDPNLRIMLASHLLEYFTWMGDGEQANQVLDIMQKLADMPGLSHLSQLIYCSKIALYYAVLGDIDTTLEWANKGIEISLNTGIKAVDTILFGIKVNAYLLCDITKAKNALREMTLLLQPNNPFMQSYHSWLRAWHYWQNGELDQAWTAALQSKDYVTRISGTPIYQGVIYHCLAWIALDRGDTQAATEYLDDTRAIGRKIGSPVFEYNYYITTAWTAFKHGREQDGLVSLAAALRECKAMHGLVWGIWGPKVMTTLLARALEADLETPLVQTLIRRLRLPAPATAGENWPWPLRIYTLGSFSLIANEVPVHFSRKTPKKPLALLKVLLAAGGQNVDIRKLCQKLWPDADDDIARDNFDVTFMRLRKLLPVEDAILINDSKLSLNPSRVWTDVGVLDRTIEDCLELLRSPNTDQTAIQCAENKLLALYRGELLENETDYPWLITARDRLHNRYLRTLKALGDFWERQENWKQAQALYELVLEHNAVEEEIYRRLMRCHVHTGHPVEALQVYQRCRTMLSRVLGVTPMQETSSLYREILDMYGK